MKIPFNLERCIAGDEVITDNGSDYVFGAYNEKMRYPLVGWLYGFPAYHSALGIDPRGHISHNLFMKPKKITRWICVNKYYGEATEEDVAKYVRGVDKSSNAIIKIEFYEGEGFEES